jgi:hypothetical protein
MADQPEALRLAERIEKCDRCGGTKAVAAELRRLYAENALLHERHHFDNGVLKELLDALKAAGLFLHHAWCDVQMNDYSFEKLNQTMIVVDAAIAKTEEQK